MMAYVIWSLSFLCCNILVEASRTNFEVKRLELCNKTQGLMKFYGNVTKENHHQYLTCNLTTPVPFDDNIGFSCAIQSRLTEKTFFEHFVIREKNFCKAANKYFGEFWYDIGRAARVPLGVCPIPAGKYHVQKLKLEFRKISLQTFPFGRLRLIIKAVDNKNAHANIWCLLLDVENTED